VLRGDKPLFQQQIRKPTEKNNDPKTVSLTLIKRRDVSDEDVLKKKMMRLWQKKREEKKY